MAPEFQPIGKILILFGAIIILVGLFLLFGDKIPYIGRLPGDIYIKKGSFSFYFPIVTLIILSIIISLVINLLRK